MCNGRRSAHTSIQGSGEHPAFPAQWLYGLAIYDFAHELLATRRVSPATFERAKKELGETSVIDLVGIIGYYGLVSVTLNAFELPLPEGEKLPFDIK